MAYALHARTCDVDLLRQAVAHHRAARAARVELAEGPGRIEGDRLKGD